MNSISLCTGYGGIELGLEMSGESVNTVLYSEIEAYSVACLLKRMEEGKLKPAPIWTDLKTFPSYSETVSPMNIDLLTGGFPCFVAGTLVLTKDGYIPIEDVKVNDEVLTHKGRWKKVINTMTKDNAPIRKIKCLGSHELLTTDEHPFYVREKSRVWDNTKRKYDRVFSKPDWKEAKELKRGNFVGQVLPPIIKDVKSESFWYLIGRFLADGWTIKTPSASCGKVIICCGYHEENELEEIIKKSGYHYCKANERTAIKFHIVKKELYEFCLKFGKKAHGKFLPADILGLEQNKAKALLEGYLSGDGSKEKCNTWRVGSVSKKLAYGIALLVQRAYGVVAQLRTYIPTREKCIIEGREVNERQRYIVQIPNVQKEPFVEGNYGWKPVRSNEITNEIATVYNISVADDESYIVNGVIAHNCQPFSSAGKQAGVEDPRHLFPNVLNIIESYNPDRVFLENVEGIISSKLKGDNWDDPEGTPVLLHIVRELERRGYIVTWGIFSAEEVGAPHRRKRVFILAYKQSLGCGGWENTDGAIKRLFSQFEEEEQSLVRCEVAGCGGELRGAYRWPSRPNEEQYEWEHPRVLPKLKLGGAVDGCNHRTNQLRMLGNGVVPQTACKAWLTLNKKMKEML